MSIWANENIIDVSFLPVYVFLLLLNMYNLWEFHWRREYVLLLISSGCITPKFPLIAVEILGIVLRLTSLGNAIVPYSVQWGISISNLAFYPLLLACVVCLEKWYDISVSRLI